MSQLYRYEDHETAIKAQILAQLLALQTSMPVKIIAFDPLTLTATCQPTIRARVQQQDGTFIWMQYPPLIFVPVVFPGGGGYTLTFPIQPDDEGLCVFSSRAIDLWWQSSGIQNPVELRHHDLSDGFVMVGPRSKPRALLVPEVSMTQVQLRSDDGTTSIGIGPMGAIAIVAPPPGKVTITGNLLVNGIITGTVVPP